MHHKGILLAFIGCLAFSGTLPLLHGQTPGGGIDRQLRSQYPIASVGFNGVVVHTGTVLLVQQDKITALPAPGEWPCNAYKQGGRIKQTLKCAVNYSISKGRTRPFQVGEKAYLTGLQIKPTEVVFTVQTCDADPNYGVPFRAAVSFEFAKGYLESMNLKEIQDAITEVFVIDTSAPPEKPAAVSQQQQLPPPPPPPAVPLKLPATYVSAQTPADQLQLNADNTLSLQEAGQTYRGTFAANGNTLDLTIGDTGTKTTATMEANKLTDSSGQTWVLQEQSAQPPLNGPILKNQDVISLAKAGLDDAIIVAKIGSSRCQFDTSTDALIELKQAGVSGAVIKAMIGAAK
jgi:hypothetical protein